MKNSECGIAINWHYIAVALIFAVAILLGVLYMPEIKEFDAAVLKTVHEFSIPYFQYVPGFISELYRNYYVWPLIVTGGIMVSHKYYLKTFLLVFFTQAAFLLSGFIKSIVCRQRPCGNAYPVYSFPSNIALTAMCFYGILIYLVHKHVYGFWKYFLITLLGLLILLTSYSRLWLGVHFPTDVLEGLFLGFILVNLYIILDKFFSRR